jgi:hypothetical protein
MQTHSHKRKDEVTRTARRAQVAAYLLGGVTDQTSIAKQLNCAQATVSRDIKAIEAQWRIDASADISEAKGHDLNRLNRLIAAVWPAAVKGEIAAVAEVRNLIKRRAEIFGYDAPKKIESKYTIEVQRAAQVLATELGMSVEEVLDEADRVLRGIPA